MISSEDPSGGQRPDSAIEFAKLLFQSAREDRTDEFRDLICMRLRDEIRADAEERAQNLVLQRRRQACKEAVLAFAGFVLAVTAFLPTARISPQVAMGLVVLAGLIVRCGPAFQLASPELARRRL